ncbi:MAG: hypothetical protein RO009_08030 [Pseudorhodoplanes sp.]|jgi:hypothetical protein|nr:hypothetical protein [Pseudorhodoplanes sp.]
MTAEFPFKRLLLKLPDRVVDRTIIETAAGFAEQLKLNLAAEVIQGAELDWLADIPGLRELRALGEGWHPIDVAYWHKELSFAESSLKGIFEASVKNRTVSASFSATRTAMPFTMSGVGSEDIVAIPQPGNPIDLISQQLNDLLQAAFETPAAVMLVPPAAGRGGPVVAIAANLHDPSIRVAIEIAVTGGQDLILVPAYKFRESISSLEAIAAGAGVPARIGELIDPASEMSSVLSDISRYNAHMLVMSRSRYGSDILAPLATLSRQRVSILIMNRALES